jgi:uncharacterized protein YbjT (DUF2867 family)
MVGVAAPRTAPGNITMKIERIALIGGSGFVGGHVATQLRARGYLCRFVTRHPHRHKDRKTIGEVVGADPFDAASLASALSGCDAAVNLVGILNSGRRPALFRRVHVELVEQVVAACNAAQVRRLLHMSALNADPDNGGSDYLRSKGEGENRAHTLGRPSMAVTSFRPSVIFGPDDSFLNRFAGLLKIPGPLPLACPDAELSPVYVGDVARAFAQSVDDEKTFGRRYELCGPRSYRLIELVRLVAELNGQRKWIVPMPDWASRLQARLLQFAPGQPFTPDNYRSLQTPGVCSQNGFAELGIVPISLENAARHFFDRGSSRRQFDRLRKVSGR